MRRFFFVFLAIAAAARADTVEERLQKLEQQVTALKLENDQLRRDLGLEVLARQATVKTAGASAENVQFGGMVQVQGESGDRGDSRFISPNARVYLRRARVNVAGRFVQEFNFRTELELSGSLTDATGLRAQLTDAYINWNRFDSANVRVGQFKTPFGFEQLYADPRLYTIERSLANDRLTLSRQIGIQVGGDAYYERFNYSIGIFNGNGTNLNFNDNDRFLTAGRVSVVPLSGRFLDQPSRWSVGVNAFRTRDSNVTLPAEFGIDSTPATPAKDNIFVGRRSGFGADSQVELGRVELWGEVLHGTFEPDDRIPLRRLRSTGGYGQAAVFVIEDKLQLVGRYETFTPNTTLSTGRTKTSVFGVNYYFKQHDLKLQVDYLHGTVGDLRGEQNKVIARLQTVF
jgi:phosphate-selective porin OprO/OprP